jgi:hypothetical protein
MPIPEFVWKVHSYTNDYIRFADAKAGAMITWCAGLIALLFTIKAQNRFMDTGPTFTGIDFEATALGFLAVSAFILLAFSVLFGFLTVLPRLWDVDAVPESVTWRMQEWPKRLALIAKEFIAAFLPIQPKHPGLIYWNSVGAYQKPEAYAAAISGSTADELTAATAHHVHVLAGIARRKYYHVDCCIRLAFVGSVAALILALFSR